MADSSPNIVWFRQDLRLTDNPALHSAARKGAPVLPVFILDESHEGDWAPGAASRWWYGALMKVEKLRARSTVI